MAARPVRVLHVLGGMDRGGVETWLINIMRNIDRNIYHMDFLVHTDRKCAYDDELKSLGSRIVPCLFPSRPITYGRLFRDVLCRHGPYDVVHSHVHHYSGYILRLAHQCGIPIRIAHSHSDTSSREATASLARKAYQRLMKTWVDRYATCGLAPSGQAAVALYGPHWQAEPRWRLLYCGLSLRPFHEQCDRQALRDNLGIPQDCFAIGHVGSFRKVKNHRFLISTAQEVALRMPRFRLLCVGDGPLREEVEGQVREAGLAERTVFTGTRNDVPGLMMSAMDAFVLPSLYEGLGMVLVEAQAAGLPVFFSDVVPPEAEVVKPLCHRLSLADSPAYWAETIINTCQHARGADRREALAMVEGSAFNINRSLADLCRVYRGISP